jgi:nucleotide-binding universal stress UspA family protein
MTAQRDRTRPARSALVGVDESLSARLALEHAAERVGPLGRLIVAHAVTPPPAALVAGPVPVASLGDLVLERRKLAEDLVTRLADQVDSQAEARVLDGRAASALATLAREEAVDEIVVGSRGFSPLRGALGSVSHALLHEADRPVVVIPERAVERRGTDDDRPEVITDDPAAGS